MQRQRKNREVYLSQVDYVFYHEEELRDAITRARLEGSIGGSVIVVNANRMSDPTANQAVKNLSPIVAVMVKGQTLRNPERWLVVIEKTYKWCKAQKDCRYEVARRRYSDEDYRKTCMELNISNSTRRRLFELVQMYAALQAVQLGLIQV